jgi:chromosome segregation ATPase
MDAADKQWFETLFTNMGQQIERIDRRLELLERRFEQIDRRFEQIDRRFEEIDQRFEQLEQRIEKVETTLLTEFHKWASPTEARLRTHTAALRALDLEHEALDERVTKLEGR